jgi:hypothetical protein
MSLEGSLLLVDVRFVSPEGIVHATMNHKIPLDGVTGDDSIRDIAEKSKELLEALHVYIRDLHFTDTDTQTTEEETARGIAESLRGEADEPG